MSVGQDRWRDNWRIISPPGAVPVDLRRPAGGRGALVDTVRALPAGTPVVLFGSAPGATRRCKAFAARAGIELERGYLAFPSARAPGYLVEDAPPSVRTFVRTMLVVPPRTRLSLLMQIGLRVLRNPSRWWMTRWVAPGRVVVGRRA
jgi:hypothetical protein